MKRKFRKLWFLILVVVLPTALRGEMVNTVQGANGSPASCAAPTSNPSTLCPSSRCGTNGTAGGTGCGMQGDPCDPNGNSNQCCLGTHPSNCKFDTWTGHSNPGPRYGCVCFVAGTLITLSDGTKIAIENVKEGDMVKSLDENGNWAISKVEKLLTHIAEDYLEVQTEDRFVRATGNHPFYTGRDLSNGSDAEYQRLDEFKVGDFLVVDRDGKPHRSKILSMKKITGHTPVYNLHNGSGPHTYLAEDFVVHNK